MEPTLNLEICHSVTHNVAAKIILGKGDDTISLTLEEVINLYHTLNNLRDYLEIT